MEVSKNILVGATQEFIHLKKCRSKREKRNYTRNTNHINSRHFDPSSSAARGFRDPFVPTVLLSSPGDRCGLR
ncbi:hypothetical protein J6590_040732 [Homalodisca vitripennis]|nr:hypothetical protein J6590_040732 [Homalodisca vitripennis]